MGKTVFALKKNGDSEEYHLFYAELTQSQPQRKCRPQHKSICKGMASSDSTENKFACYSEDEARLECARIGREVCGTCVSHLYASYDS